MDDNVGGKYQGKPILDENGIINQLNSDYSVDTKKGVITYAFLDTANAPGIYNNPKYGFTEQNGYSKFTEAQRTAAREAVSTWDELVAVSFKEVNGQGGADIVYANTTTGPAQAWAYYPHDYGAKQLKHLESDVWIANPAANPSNGQLGAGFYGLTTLVHETGHAIGLSHPGDYNYDPNLDLTYGNYAEYAQDSLQFSIMSYWESFQTGAQPIDFSLMRYVYPSTPMVHDILAIQEKYGVDTTTRTGDTTYGFNATSDVTNQALRFTKGELASIFTIWDAGGNDTLDLSGYATPSVIDLRPGSYSSAGGATERLTLAEINANNAAAGLGARSEYLYDVYFKGVAGVNDGKSWDEITGDTYLMRDNIGIAYGATVENAVGGSGDDVIIGNAAANKLTGGGGADRFVFANDKSVDTITDFQSGTDRIDLTELGADAETSPSPKTASA